MKNRKIIRAFLDEHMPPLHDTLQQVLARASGRVDSFARALAKLHSIPYPCEVDEFHTPFTREELQILKHTEGNYVWVSHGEDPHLLNRSRPLKFENQGDSAFCGMPDRWFFHSQERIV